MVMKTVEEALRDAIRGSGQTQKEIAKGAGLVQSTISKVLNSQLTPTLLTVTKLMKYFGFKVIHPDGREIM